MTGRQVLVVDDEPKLVDVVRSYLQRDGYQVLTAGNGAEALDVFRGAHPDLVILDVMLPVMDGLEVCRRLRRESSVPIIMLTARAEELDELLGLELGADDYVTKPFSPRALAARVQAVLRRASPSDDSTEQAIVAGPVRVDPTRHEVIWNGTEVPVTPAQFRLMAALARRPGRVFQRLELMEHMQGDAYAGCERTVDAHVKNLRKKLAQAGGEAAAGAIVTVAGVGYKLEARHA
ncbi:MAG: response regulator transcription factor [Chloroflexota bacterium]